MCQSFLQKKLHRDYPPSFAPSKQPKSLLRALKGIPHDGKLEFLERCELASRRARRKLTQLDISAKKTAETGPAVAGSGQQESCLDRRKFSEKLQNE